MEKVVGVSSDPGFLLTSLLKEVSRSFYLTLRVLPAAVRSPIGIAYLLARASDTIADTELVPVAARLEALRSFAGQIQGDGQFASLPLSALEQQQSNSAERVLLHNIPATVALLDKLQPADRKLVRQVLTTIISGQELDLERFTSATRKNIIALNTAAELDDYTYRVAGCVGEFWTHATRTHLFPSAPLDLGRFLAEGVQFGKGLQLVNILRDLPADLAAGRCYMPKSELATLGLAPAELLDPGCELRFRPMYDSYLANAESKLRCGWHYTNTVPRGQVRVRLACAWPILIGLETIRLLQTSKVLEPSRRVKVSRRQVRGILIRSILYYPWSSAWCRLANRH